MPIPIGVANNMHSNCVSFYTENMDDFYLHKSNSVFMNFNVNTNFEKRNACLQALKHKVVFLPNIDTCDNLKRLSQYKFCICPEGNGADTHRLWEALYLQTVPIVVDSDFIRIIKKHINPPMIILESWEDFNESVLDYSAYTYILSDPKYLDKFTFEHYKRIIC